ncbi:RNA-binding protein [Brevibacillus fluminis]|uniref:YlmH family RNA-binding protein n=1 Tax=Brevibacillus fluminis TaxID=511487 RepID=UPI003F886D1D
MSMYDHYRKEELPFVERALEMLKQAERKQTLRLTDFMDPRQLAIMQSLTSQADVKVTASGGYEGAERVRAVIHPPYMAAEEEDYQLTLAEISGDQRFLKLTHKDVLGALLHIGLKREKFGDILLDERGCQVIVAREVFSFIQLQLTQVHRLPVECTEIPWTSLRIPEKRRVEKHVTLPSLRLDAVIGEVHHLSRTKALVPIRAGKVKVNWKVTEDPSHHVGTGDVISVGGFGRFEIIETGGPTKSGRTRMIVGIYA